MQAEVKRVIRGKAVRPNGRQAIEHINQSLWLESESYLREAEWIPEMSFKSGLGIPLALGRCSCRYYECTEGRGGSNQPCGINTNPICSPDASIFQGPAFNGQEPGTGCSLHTQSLPHSPFSKPQFSLRGDLKVAVTMHSGELVSQS